MKKLNRTLFFAIAIAIISVVDSWAGCHYVETYVDDVCNKGGNTGCGISTNPTTTCYSFVYAGTCVMLGCGSGTTYYKNVLDGSYPMVSCVMPGYGRANVTYCDTQTEADSVNCERNGNVWQDGTCKENHCKTADSTWLSTSIAACTGSNNYAIVNTESTCEHAGTCCPNDSIPSGNTCKWRCDSVLTTCNGRTGDLFGGVLPDTSISGQDTTFSYRCYYNCSHSPNQDSTVYLVEGNTVLSGPNDSIADGIKSETFNSVRTTTGGVYVYDYLSPAASEYIDSIAAMKCVEHLWRCVINNKYVYWSDNQDVPAGCTNIVRVK